MRNGFAFLESIAAGFGFTFSVIRFGLALKKRTEKLMGDPFTTAYNPISFNAICGYAGDPFIYVAVSCLFGG